MLASRSRNALAVSVVWRAATLGVGASFNCGHHNARGDSDSDDDDDDDDDNNNNGSHHSSSRSAGQHGSATSTSTSCSATLESSTGVPSSDGQGGHHGLSKGAIAGIVVALLLALLALLAILLCYRKRHRQRFEAIQTLESANIEKAPNDAVGTAAMRQADPLPISQRQDDLDVPPVVVPLLAPTEGTRHEQEPVQQRLRNLQRSGSITSLPNPYDAYDPERTLPPAPSTDSGHSDYATLLAIASSPTSASHPPSSYVAVADLSRGSTQASSSSRLSTSSLLHSEIQTYQKRLEAHHEKELAARGESSRPGYPSVPSDPPPMYTENTPATTASDV